MLKEKERGGELLDEEGVFLREGRWSGELWERV